MADTTFYKRKLDFLNRQKVKIEQDIKYNEQKLLEERQLQKTQDKRRYLKLTQADKKSVS